MPSLRFIAVSLGITLLSCGGDRAAGPPAPATESRWRGIINGTLDTTHQAVVLVYSDSTGSACGGTIIHVNGNQGVVLTAAHCVEAVPTAILQGDDFNDPNLIIYPVVEVLAHPSFDGASAEYDFGLVRFTGATASTPAIPVTSDPDGLSAGTVVRHVGYGLTSYPSGDTTLRHETTNVIDLLEQHQFGFPQTISGPCMGDSGGPSLSMTIPEVVVGIFSSCDADCSEYGVSGRVAPVVASFIQPFIDGLPPVLTCDECRAQATLAPGDCRDPVDACLDDTDCSAYVGCLDGCVDAACEADCADQHPAGQALHETIDACVCDVACATECAEDPTCHPAPQTCAGPGDCTSTFCVDGYCCDRACDGQCEACDLGAAPGVCGPVAGAPHGQRTACATDGSRCGGACDGVTPDACAYPTDDASCLAAGCDDARATAEAACDGLGACAPADTTDCTPYTCDGAACAIACEAPEGCATGHTCTAEGTCVVEECERREDCGTDQRCEAGQCVPDPDGDAGCACRTGGTSGIPVPWFLLALIPLLGRRRNRSRR